MPICVLKTEKSDQIAIKIHQPSWWYFIFGQSSNLVSDAQVRFLIDLPVMRLLLATRKRVSWIKKP